MRGKGTPASVGQQHGATPALPSQQNEEHWRGFAVSGSQTFSGFIVSEEEATMDPLRPKGAKTRKKQSQDPSIYFFFFTFGS